MRYLVAFLFALLVLVPAAYSQGVTGQISGTVVDPAGSVVIGAKVELTQDITKQVREYTTEANGNFIFTGLVPGSYSLRVTQAGFKGYDQKAVTVAAQERVDLHEVKLQVGDVTTSISVEANTVHVATDSSDRSVSINLAQIEDTPTRGRNPLSLIVTLPGVQTLASSDTRGWSGGGIPAVNGGQSGQTILNLDGAASQDSGNLNPGYLSPSVDSIGEVKLLVSNYTAEYGGRTGGQLTITTKAGTPSFHGSAYYYHRHEMFNAQEWFNNRNSTATVQVQKPKYRYQNPGGTLGGPLVIPGTNFNKSRTKLFFFFSYDYTRNKATINNTYTMPSALERAGDFSDTRLTTGALVPIYDPTNNQTQYPGNKIPASQISKAGQAMLNLFPLPNENDPTGQRAYNFRAILPQSRPNEDKILRVDYNFSPRTVFYARLIQDYQAVDGYAGTVGPSGGAWGQFPHSYHVQAAGAIGTLVYTFSPNLINEFSWGVNRGKQGVNPLSGITSGTTGGTHTFEDNLLPLKDSTGAALTLPRINAASNILGLLPQVNFGLPSGFSAQSSGQGVPSGTPSFGHDSRWPFTGTDTVQTIQNKVTWVKGNHALKAGLYVELMSRNVSVYSVYNAAGTYYFGSDRASALDTGYPYANAMVGSMFAYGDDNKKQVNHAHYQQIEWFVQDTWKIGRRLTLDIGSRFHRVGDLYSEGATLGLFSKEEYSASKVGQLLFPAKNAAGQNIAVNPVSGATFPYVRQGTFDTSTYTGMPFSGIKQYDSHFYKVPPIQVGPRLGFAYDVFGDGKTAVRGGGAITIGRNWTVDDIGAQGAGQGPMAAPPNFLAPVILYTNFNNLAAGSQAYLTPQLIIGGTAEQKVQTTYNWSIGVQQDLGNGLIADVSYVGNALRHGYGRAYDFNAVRPYTTWNPTDGQIQKYRDPTSSGFYSTNLIRSMVGYSGWAGIPISTYQNTSNYNALQMQLNRRTGNLQWNVNYTWSRTINYGYSTTALYNQWVNADLNKQPVNRTHAVNFNFGYTLPKVSKLVNNVVIKQVLDDWKVNGNGALFSGTPFTVSCGSTGAPAGYWTGTPTGQIPFRCQMGSSEFLPEGQYPKATDDPRLQPFRLNAANWSLPAIDSWGIGNTPPALYYGPGAFNLDLSVSKNFKITESKSFELRAETFNTLNHMNPNNPNSSLTYAYSATAANHTGAQTNANFGLVQGTQVGSRRMILSGRFRF
jgi:hypothetical protein